MKYKVVKLQEDKYEVYEQPFFSPWTHVENFSSRFEAEMFISDADGTPEDGFKVLMPF